MNKYIKKNIPSLVGATICVLISTVFAVLVQFLKGDVLDYAIAGSTSTTVIYAVMLITFIMLEVGLHYCYNRFRAAFSVDCTKKLKADLFESIIKRSYVSYKQQNQGDYIAKYTNDVELISNLHFSTITILLEILIKVLFVSIALFLLDWRIALITLFLLTTPLYVPKIIEGKLQRTQSDYAAAVEGNLTKVTDWLSGFEIIKNFSAEKKIIELFHYTNDETMDKILKNKQLGHLAMLLSTLISYLSYFIILVFAAVLVLKGNFSAGDFFVAIGMIDQLSYPLISLSELIQSLIGVKPICARMADFINNGDSKATKNNNDEFNFDRDIRFDNISFSYDKKTDLLKNFTLILQKGGRYLLKGQSGSGKTTVTNLLLKYYEADDGLISIDGIPLSNFEDMYGLITVVRQDAVLFNDTLRNNLTMYRDKDDIMLINLLNRLGLSKFASKEALDMVIAEGGSNLSGGERKRICIARALLRDTEVLILDEPLANLDESTVIAIEKELLGIKDRTLLIVSHIFSDKNASKFDQIIQME